MELPKAFECIPHSLLIAKLDSYGLDRNLLKHINSYLDNRKQCVRINNINSAFNDLFRKRSVVGPILFNFFHDGGRYHIETIPLICSANQWTGFYVITASAVRELTHSLIIFSFLCNMLQFITSLTTTHFQTFDKLKEILESESECAIKWFTRNGMLLILINLKPSLFTKKEQTTQMKKYKLAMKIFKLYHQLNY